MRFLGVLVCVAAMALFGSGCGKKSSSIQSEVEDAAKAAGDAVKSAADATTDAAGKAADAVKDTAEDAVDAAKDAVK